jgi:hypothetical protein
VLDWGQHASGAIIFTQNGEKTINTDVVQGSDYTSTTTSAGMYEDQVGIVITNAYFFPAFHISNNGTEYIQEYSDYSLVSEDERNAKAMYMMSLDAEGADGAYEGCNILPGCPFPWTFSADYFYKVSANTVKPGGPKIKIYPDGHYEIETAYPWESNMTGPWEYEETGTDSSPGSTPVAPISTNGDLIVKAASSIKVTGLLNADDPGHLVGSKSIPSSVQLNGKLAAQPISVPTTITVEWDINLDCPGTDYLTCQ